MDKLKKYINGNEETEEEQNGIIGQVDKTLLLLYHY